MFVLLLVGEFFYEALKFMVQEQELLYLEVYIKLQGNQWISLKSSKWITLKFRVEFRVALEGNQWITLKSSKWITLTFRQGRTMKFMMDYPKFMVHATINDQVQGRTLKKFPEFALKYES